MPNESLFRQIPAVSKVLEDSGVKKLSLNVSRQTVLEAVHEFLHDLRDRITKGQLSEESLRVELSDIEGAIAERIEKRLCPSLRPVINATGVIVFTNAGRSPIQGEILQGLSSTAQRYTNLEYDLNLGRRGHRDLHFESRITRLLGCEAATVCNNAAAAILLILNTLAQGKKVLVSRGELIEIGGSFRLPAVMEKSGAILKEVGTTNKTKPSDYLEAIDSETALILRVHPSNYQIIGFTQRPELEELTAISRETGIPFLHDVGSGYLFRTEHPFLNNEPTVVESLSVGCDLVCFSGDKLLGGPQAGLILGRKDLVDSIRKNSLMRALRVDKLTYSALEWTLMEYEKQTYQETLPVWKFMNLSSEQLKSRTELFLQGLDNSTLTTNFRNGFSVTGGGSAPEEQIPTWLIEVTSQTRSPNQLEAALRANDPPILCRIEKDRILIDLRTVFPDEDQIILDALNSLS